MGERRRRKQQFLKAHPFCCFCGGSTPATTEDHQPGRIFFQNRQWPEGFVFPACEACNAVSRLSERVLGVLVHGHAEDEDRNPYRKNLESVRREFPNEIDSLVCSSNEIRAVFRERNLTKPADALFRDIPLIKMETQFWKPHFDMLTRKLLLALHYQCFGVALPPSGGLWGYFHTNVDFATGEFPKEILEAAEHLAVPTRQKRLLGDQFLVRWGLVKDCRTALFVVQFHRKFAISGITTETPEAFGESGLDGLMRAFGPAAAMSATITP